MAVEYLRVAIVFVLMQAIIILATTSYLRITDAYPAKQMVDFSPIIGVLTQPFDDDTGALQLKYPGKGYIPQNYVSFLQAAGARIVPVPYEASMEDTISLVSSLNGVLFTGGSLNLTDPVTGALHPYSQTSLTILEYAKSQVKAGGYYPLWGTCQGFQLLHILVANDSSVLVPSNSWDFNINLEFTVDSPKTNTRIFNDFSLELLSTLSAKNITFHVNNWGIKPEAYYTHPKLANFFTPVAQSVDMLGNQYVAVVQAKEYPIYAVQYHPEKSQFDFTPAFNINHEPASIETSYRFAKFFVDEARKNSNNVGTFKQASAKTIENYEFYYSYSEKGTTRMYIV